MGKVGRFIGGVVTIAAGVAIGVFTGQWSLAVAVMSVGTGMLIPPVPMNLNERQGMILENRVGAMDRLPVVYGTVKIAGVMADIRVDPASTGRKRLLIVPAFCHGSRSGAGITGIDEVWFDDRRALNGTTMATPFSNNPEGSGAAHFLEYEHHLGSTTQTVDARLNALFPVEWPSTSRGLGVCYSRFEMWYDNEVYPGGIPNIQVKMRGNSVYDPRDSTWKFSTNPALCIRDYLLSTVYGLGIPEAALEEQSFIDMANYCDELVNIPGGGTQKRYEMNGWVDTARNIETNLAEMCSSCRAQVVNEGSKWRIIIRRQRIPTGFHIDVDNTLDGTWQFVLPGADLVPNVVRASYVDPERNYDVDQVQWPEPGQANAYLTEDNDYEQRMTLDLPFTTNRVQAQQICMTTLKEARSMVGAICTLKEDATQLRVGDLVYVTHETPGWSYKIFDVAALLLQSDGGIQAVLMEYDEEAYDVDEQETQPNVPDTSLPSPFEVPAPTSLVLTSVGQELQTNDGRYIPRIRATWAVSNHPFIDYYEVQAKKTADTSWDSFGRVSAREEALFFVYPVTDEQWSVRIQAVNSLGVRSEWLEADTLVVTPDPRPQILSITLTNAHVDTGHIDTHTDVAHADAAHADSHTDTAHTDHSDHSDAHGDDGGHDDTAHDDTHGDIGFIDTDHTDTHTDNAHSDHSDGHGDTHSDTDHGDTAHDDTHGDIGMLDTDHTDSHADNAHSDHSDSGLSHFDVAHVDSHTDTGHSDSAHSDGHTDSAHGDGQHGVGVAIQADTDTASVRAIARKHGDVAAVSHTDGAHTDTPHTDVTEPTVTEVRTMSPVDGRNVVIELIDAATGAQIALAPGDSVRIGALAYSGAAATGVEGPLALASIGLFTVAPVGADLWVPS